MDRLLIAREFGAGSEVADMYPAYLIGSRGRALMAPLSPLKSGRAASALLSQIGRRVWR